MQTLRGGLRGRARRDRAILTASGELRGALRDEREVQLTVTGRKSGNESSRPIWFVQDGDRVLLVPVGGSHSNWYRNALKTPEVRLAAEGAELGGTAKPIQDPAGVAEVLEKFSQKYGADQVQQFYPNQDAALEVPLS